MGFHFPVSLHEMTAEERSILDKHIISLKEETKIISDVLCNNISANSDSYINDIALLLRRYSAIIFGNIMDSKCRVKPITRSLITKADTTLDQNEIGDASPIMKMLKDELAPFVFSMTPMSQTSCYNRQLSKYRRVRYSRLGEGFVTLIGSYVRDITRITSKLKLNKQDTNYLAIHGVIILNTLNA